MHIILKPLNAEKQKENLKCSQRKKTLPTQEQQYN